MKRKICFCKVEPFLLYQNHEIIFKYYIKWFQFLNAENFRFGP